MFCAVGSEALHSAYLLSLSQAPQLSQDIPADASFLCDKAAVLFTSTNTGPVSYFDEL